MSETSTVNPALSAGQLLRLAREQQGMHIAMLAAHIKVPVKKVQALESDQLEEFASPVFARSMASSVCRVLKVDAAPVLALLPQADNLPLSKPSRVLEEPPVRFRPSSAGRSGPSRTTYWVAGGLAIVTLLVAFVPDLSSRFTSSSPATSGVATEAVAPVANMANQVQVPEVPATAGAASTADTNATAAAGSGAATSTAVPVASAAPSTTATSAAPQAAASATPPTAPSAPASTSTPATAPVKPIAALATSSVTTSGVLGLSAKGDSWIQVADAQGQLLLSRVVNKGETVTLDGALPLKVVIGRVDATEVSVRGKPFSMADIAQGNVARFEVK